jgi:hypothetical protein
MEETNDVITEVLVTEDTNLTELNRLMQGESNKGNVGWTKERSAFYCRLYKA